MRESMKHNCEFVATPDQWQAFVEALDRPARTILDLARLFPEQKKRVLDRENMGNAEEENATQT